MMGCMSFCLAAMAVGRVDVVSATAVTEAAVESMRTCDASREITRANTANINPKPVVSVIATSQPVGRRYNRAASVAHKIGKDNSSWLIRSYSSDSFAALSTIHSLSCTTCDSEQLLILRHCNGASLACEAINTDTDHVNYACCNVL
jgi:hypothetical protein